jgi:hypothetical protein
MTEVKVKIHAITIKDENSGEERTIRTVRNLDDVAEYLYETERDAVRSAVEMAVHDTLTEAELKS